MNKNKQILKYAPNFYKIINFEYFENDYVTEKLISIYEEFIFGVDVANPDELNKVVEIDKVLNKYIDDYVFRSEMKYELTQIKVRTDEANILDAIVKSIIKIFDRYVEGYTRSIYISRWI